MKHVLTSTILALAIFISLAGGQQSRRALPDDNLAYPVLITYKNGTGSGFYFVTKTATYLVTAKHVLFDPIGKLLDTSFNVISYSKDLSDPTPNTATIDTTKLAPENLIRHPTEDVAIVKMFSPKKDNPGRIDPIPGVTVRFAKDGIVGIGVDSIKKFSDVLVGNDVILLGYPTSLGLQTMPQIDPLRPLLRKGIVAGANPQGRSIILDCPAYFGNSGGPVIEVDQEGSGTRRFTIIGVVNQYVPYADGGKTFLIMANSGYSVATPMDFVLELIK